MHKRRLMMAVFMLVLAVVFSACGSDDSQVNSSGQQIEIIPSAENSSEESPDFYVEPVAEKEPIVYTEFGNLYYQEQWLDFMKTEQKKNDGNITVQFKAEINAKDYPLFTVVIGEGEGSYVGELTDANGTNRKVYVIVEEIATYPELTEGEQNRLYAMQEDINYVIDNLK